MSQVDCSAAENNLPFYRPSFTFFKNVSNITQDILVSCQECVCREDRRNKETRSNKNYPIIYFSKWPNFQRNIMHQGSSLV